MVSICVTCSVKGQRLSPLSDEYRKLLHHIVSPVVNMGAFGDYPLNICLTCNLWMEDVYKFQKKACKSVRAFLKVHLSSLESQPSDQVLFRPMLEPKLEPISSSIIKKDPDKQTDLKPESSDEKPQTVEIEVKLEPESKLDGGTNQSMNADDSDTSLPDPSIASGSAGPTGFSITGEKNMINVIPNALSNPGVEQSLKLISTKKRKTVTKKISVKSIPAEKLAQLAKTGQKVLIKRIINPFNSHQNVSSNLHVAENAAISGSDDGKVLGSTHKGGKNLSQDSKQGVRKVRKRIRKKVPMTCPLCGKTFSGYQTLYVHNIRKHHGLSRPSCEKCEKTFCSEIGLKEHMKRIHEEPKETTIEDMKPEWFCVECAIQFKVRRDYDLHMLTLKHTPREQCTFVCEFCAKRFATKIRLDNHVNSMHLKKANKKVFKCGICEKTYAASFTLHAHIRTAHENQPKKRPHVCHLCGKSYTAKNNLADHLLVHQGIRPYKCHLCPATFSYSGALFTHNKHVHSIPNKGETDINGVETKLKRRKVKKAEAD